MGMSSESLDEPTHTTTQTHDRLALHLPSSGVARDKIREKASETSEATTIRTAAGQALDVAARVPAEEVVGEKAQAERGAGEHEEGCCDREDLERLI